MPKAAYADGAIRRTLLDISPTGESVSQRTATAEAAEHWYRDITGKMFG